MVYNDENAVCIDVNPMEMMFAAMKTFILRVRE